MDTTEKHLLDLQFDIMAHTKLDSAIGVELSILMNVRKPGTAFIDFSIREIKELIKQAKQNSKEAKQ